MSISGHDLGATTAENYRAFAVDARDRSPQYEELALAVADNLALLAFLDALPPAKRQPNLLFAAACYLLGGPADLAALRKLIGDRGGELAATMRARRTQTNEPARCATLLPAMTLLPQPLALIEVGASAGLTLLMDRYSYDYRGHRLTGVDPQAPELVCEPRGPVPLPAQVPEVAWRAGLDLNPLDVTDDDDVQWLQCLLWPGEHGRLERLAAAIDTARRDPPKVFHGDLVTDTAALASRAPRGTTLVIFHSAALTYVGVPERARFASVVQELGREQGSVWLSNEAPGVVPGIATQYRAGGRFVLIRDGTQAMALTDGHGASVEWLPGA